MYQITESDFRELMRKRSRRNLRNLVVGFLLGLATSGALLHLVLHAH